MTQTIDDNGAVHDRRGRFAEKPSTAAAGAADLGVETMLEQREREAQELRQRERELRAEVDGAMIAATLAEHGGSMTMTGVHEVDEDAEPDEDGDYRPWVVRWPNADDDETLVEYVDDSFGGSSEVDGGEVEVDVEVVERGGRTVAVASDSGCEFQLVELAHWNGGDAEAIDRDFQRLYEEHSDAEASADAAELAARLERSGEDEISDTVRSPMFYGGDITTTVRRTDDGGYKIDRIQRTRPRITEAGEEQHRKAMRSQATSWTEQSEVRVLSSSRVYRPGEGVEMTSSTERTETVDVEQKTGLPPRRRW